MPSAGADGGRIERADAPKRTALRDRSPAHRRRARETRRRRAVAALVLAGPMLFVFATDVLRRAPRIAAFDRMHRLGYAGSLVESLVFWAVLLHASSRRRTTVLRAIATTLFFVLFTIVMGTEDAFHWFYNIYLSIDGQLHSKSIPWSIVGSLPLSRPFVIVHFAIAAALAALFVFLARRFVRPGVWSRRLVPLLVPPAMVMVTRVPVSFRSIQSTAFDMIYFNGMTGLVKERLGITHDSPDLRVQKRFTERVPELHASPKRPRNVLMILQESQRADVTCSEYVPDCQLSTRSSNKAAPKRLPLLQLRANDSTTAISISNLWSGVPPTEGRELLHSAPLLWDYAHAAGWDTAYWTSQNLMFGNARLYVQEIPVSHRCVATELDPESDLDYGALDSMVTDRAIHDWDELKEPFFAVVHYSNVHFPYVYDENYAPFQPAAMDKAADKNEEFKNYYKDVVYLSDMAVGRLIDYVRASASGKRTIIVYTSDHGESFREHWQLGHTSSVYDEEIHVPGWIDAPEGTLAPEEEASLRAAKDELVWHMDLAPTFLDLMGIWDDPALTPFRARMIGHPITRRERSIEPMPLTNCTWVWECAFRNWGYMLGPLKLEAREWDAEYHCFNVLEDPDEQNNLGEAACGPLPEIARAKFHVMPDVVPPGRPAVDWGRK